MTRFQSRFTGLALLGALLSGVAGVAQSSTTSSASQDDADLRQMVHDLSLRVSALEEELHKERALAPNTTAMTHSTTAASDIRGSVESISSSGVAAIPAAAASASGATQAAGASATPVLSALPTQLPGGATLNYTFDGFYDYDFDHPIGRVQYLRAYDVLSNAFSINQADVVLALDPDVGRRPAVWGSAGSAVWAGDGDAAGKSCQ